MSSLLRSPRWILLTLAVLAVAATCVALGLWQLDRLEQRRAFNRTVEQRLRLPPLPLHEAGVVGRPDELRYRRVEVRGRYDASREIVLFGRTLEGTPGNHVLTALVLEDGSAVLVDRGWVPIELDDPPLADSAPPVGEITATGVLFPSEGEDPAATTGDTGLKETGEVDLARIQAALPYELLPAYLWLQEQQPPQSLPLPQAVPFPDLTEGPPHLSYAVQWFIFATIAVIGYAVLLRREIGSERSPARSPGAES